MKKTLLALIALLTICFAMAAPVHAAEVEPISIDIEPISGIMSEYLVLDAAGMLSDSDWQKLNDRALELTAKYECEIRIFTVPDMGSEDALEYAKDIFRANGFGYGPDQSGIMLLLSEADRDFALIAHGYGNVVLTDHGRGVILDKYILPLLKENKYVEAFTAYLDKTEEFLVMARAGTPFDVDTDEEYLAQQAAGNRAAKIVFNILIPFLVALIVCLIFRAQMKTARKQRAAANYIPEGGFILTGSSDTFMYKTESRTVIESKSSGGTTTDGGFSGSSGKY